MVTLSHFPRTILAAVAVLAVVLLTGCGNSAGASDKRYVPGDGSAVIINQSDRSPAPAVVGSTLDGKPFDLASLRGKVVALNVWASWCAPCRSEAPALNQVSTEMAPKGVQFVGMDTRDTKAAAEAFVRRFEVPYPNLWDPDGQLQLLFRGNLPPQAIPSTVFIDRQGRVAGQIIGEADRSQLREILTELSNEPA